MVISDYNKGYVTQEKLFELVEWFEGPVFIDTKKRDVPDGCYVKLNDLEYDKLETKSDNIIITRGDEGTEYKGKLYPAEKVKVFDVVGAGDTFLAALTYGYLKYGTIEEAIPLANKAAAVAVSHRGTYVLTEEDVKKILC
jgi:D-beta-D-heptose 7-phosphate kinase/D-beta-D-heptose 1-phosphate adenosyltransferase